MWHWLYKDENDLPIQGRLVITIKWNGLPMSSEAEIRYEVDKLDCEFYIENGVQKARFRFTKDKEFHKTVAWAYIDEPENK